MWNLTVDQWAAVLRSDQNPSDVAHSLAEAGRFVPWSQVLVNETTGCTTTADLGSGRGEHSAVLARAGRQTTLVDWSGDNLAFSQGMFRALGLHGRFCQADITKPLPLESRSIDAVFSCGVFEYFPRAQVERILAEAFRVARKRVIIMVPNARSVAYRLGKWHMERSQAWPWGGEEPSHSLRAHFRAAGATNVREYSIGARHALGFLTMRGGERLTRLLTRALHMTDDAQPSRFRQGYLLVTIGDHPDRT